MEWKPFASSCSLCRGQCHRPSAALFLARKMILASRLASNFCFMFTEDEDRRDEIEIDWDCKDFYGFFDGCRLSLSGLPFVHVLWCHFEHLFSLDQSLRSGACHCYQARPEIPDAGLQNWPAAISSINSAWDMESVGLDYRLNMTKLSWKLSVDMKS